MSPVTHFLVSWVGADLGASARRDRALIALAGTVPDLDGLGYFVEPFTKSWNPPFLPFSDYHHVFCHNLLFGLLAAAACLAFAQKRLRTALLALLVFHVHILCDIVGARGPDGSQWPIPYLWPFTWSVQWVWFGQWGLNAWPNFVITGTALAAILCFAWRWGHSPLEMVSLRANAAFVKTLRDRFNRKAQEDQDAVQA